MDQKKPSPRILAVSWGHMKVEGLGAGKDFKLYPGGGRERDWSETGMRHSPGIQPADVEEFLAHGAAAVVLSQGMDKRLQNDCPLGLMACGALQPGSRRPPQNRHFGCDGRSPPGRCRLAATRIFHLMTRRQR